MSSEENSKKLAPDNQLLAEIFGPAESSSTNIIAQTFKTCTFTARAGSGEDVLVRLEAEGSQISAVSAIQELATMVIPDLVPNVHKLGTASTEDGKILGYSVTTYIRDAITLEDVWSDLADDQQLHVVEQVASAIEMLQGIDLRGDKAQHILKPAKHSLPKEPIIPLGGPSLGFFSNMHDLVRGFVSSQFGPQQITITDTDDGGIKFKSSCDDIPPVAISRAAIDALQDAVVLCHNDLEPRNILVQAEETGSSPLTVQYKVVAIIDWEMAGFFPFAFEFLYKDLILGSSNLYYSWYRLFKDQTARCIHANSSPLTDAQKHLFMALDMGLESRARASTRNVGKLVQRKWIERDRLVKSGKVSLGWVRGPEAGDVQRFSKEDNKELE
ncbi:uncharacterized protein GIQ15_00615 [Arthroderma uncinatum]|uniref:uncharacterized protein n=1 Tax=Arthroderma uncinatum TaxID=74035 RepID=UPI00144A7AD2|nr:uncharacterized protein GIQ15_00615 [Arthroderma uncinatum]KAF3491098.1 hypothetical protein GIQ15_00615 [Arthroderma uncinatum]